MGLSEFLGFGRIFGVWPGMAWADFCWVQVARLGFPGIWELGGRTLWWLVGLRFVVVLRQGGAIFGPASVI